jgi:hypothetical protein
MGKMGLREMMENNKRNDGNGNGEKGVSNLALAFSGAGIVLHFHFGS